MSRKPHRTPDRTGDHLRHCEVDEDLAVARLAFLAQGDHAALDAAIDAYLAHTERTLYTRWRTIGFLGRVRYEDQPTPEQPATSSAGRSNGGKAQAPESSRGRRRNDQPGPDRAARPGPAASSGHSR
jgi:hypothetical protein